MYMQAFSCPAITARSAKADGHREGWQLERAYLGSRCPERNLPAPFLLGSRSCPITTGLLAASSQNAGQACPLYTRCLASISEKWMEVIENKSFPSGLPLENAGQGQNQHFH
jgi:hypothetical protein